MSKKKIQHRRNNSSNSNYLVGLELGKYRLGTILGQGAFGTVHSGLDIVSGDIVAIKKISVPHESLSEIKSEVSSLLHLAHQHIVEYIDEPIYNIDPTNATVYICMEYMEGGSLADMIKKYGPMSPDLAKNCLMQSLSGLEYLHAQGVIHRDIKGKNILSTKNGLVKLADFGCAFFKAGQDTNELTAVAGSPFWMAPEIIEQSSSPTTACDIWSLGCTLIEVLTGKPPYANLEPMSALYHMCSDERLLDHVTFPLGASDPIIIAFLEMCLQKQPDRRAKATDLLTTPFLTNAKVVRRSSGKNGGEGERRKSKTKSMKSIESSSSRNNSNDRRNELLLNTNSLHANISDVETHNTIPSDDHSKESSLDNTITSNNAASNTDTVLQDNITGGGSGVISLSSKNNNTHQSATDGRPRVGNSSALATHVLQARELLELIIRLGSQVIANRAKSKRKSLYVYDEVTEEEIENVCGRNAQSLCRQLKARPGLASALVNNEGAFSIGRLVRTGGPGLRVLSALCSRSPLLLQQIGGSGILRVLLNQLDTGITELMEVDLKESIKELEEKKSVVQSSTDAAEGGSTPAISHTDAQNLQQDHIISNNGCLPIVDIFSCIFGNRKSINYDDESPGLVSIPSSPSPALDVTDSIVLVAIPSSLVEAARLVKDIAMTNNASLRMLADAGGMSVICKMLGIYRVLPWKSGRIQMIDDMVLELQSMESPLSHNGFNLLPPQIQSGVECEIESQIKAPELNDLSTDIRLQKKSNLTDTQLEWERELASSAFGTALSQKSFTESIVGPVERFTGRDRDRDSRESSAKSQLENISHRRVLNMVRMALECLERFLQVATTIRNISSDNSQNSRSRPEFFSAGIPLETATDHELATDISSLPPISGGVRESVNLLLEYDIPKLLIGALYRYQQEYMTSVTSAASHRRHLCDTNMIEVHSGSETDEDRNSVENGLRYKAEAGLGTDDDSTSESGLDLGDRDREREDSATPEGSDAETTSPTLGLNLEISSGHEFHEGDESESDRENHNVAFIYSGHGQGTGFDYGSAASVCSDLSEDPSLSDFSSLNDQNINPTNTTTIAVARDSNNGNFQLRKITNIRTPSPPVPPIRPRASKFSRNKYAKDSTGISISRLRKQCRQITEMIWTLVRSGPSTGVCEALCQELQESEYNVHTGLCDFNGSYFGENQRSFDDEFEKINTPLGAMLSCVTSWNDRMRWTLNIAVNYDGRMNVENNYEYIASKYWSELATYAGTVLYPLLRSMYAISERPIFLQCFEDECAIHILTDLLRCSNECAQMISSNINNDNITDRDKDRVEGSTRTMERSCRKIQTQTMRVLYNLCHLSSRRQEQAIREGLILDLITLYNTNKALGNSGMNNSIIRHVIFILCDLAHSPTCCKTLVHQGGIMILGDILAESYESGSATDELKNEQKIKEEFHAGSLVLLAISASVAESDNALLHLVDCNPHTTNQSKSIGTKIIEFISIRLEIELEDEDKKQKELSNDMEILTKPTILYMIQKLGEYKPEIEGAKILLKKLQTKFSEVSG